MPLAEAKGLLERRGSRSQTAYTLSPDEPAEDGEALRKLAHACERFSPVVGMEESPRPESLLLDVTGCGSLFGGEENLLASIARDFRRWGWSVRLALADTIGAAWAVAHAGAKTAQIVPPGEQEKILRPLRIESLRLPDDAVDSLRQLGIERIEQLQALPASCLPARFGPEVLRRLAQALGNVAELIVPERPCEPIEAERSFEFPTSHRPLLETVIQEQIERIVERLRPHSQGVQRLWIQFKDPVGEITAVSIGTLWPSDSAAHLWELVRLRLGTVRLTREVETVRLRATVVASLESAQPEIFDSGERRDDRCRLAQLVDRLSNRLGEKGVLRPRWQADHQPERASRLEPFLESSPGRRNLKTKGKAKQTPAEPETLLERLSRFRPVRLKARPIAVKVMSAVPDGPPVRFWRGDCEYTVGRFWGPERIETGWWRSSSVRRDYYRIETASGQQFWLFRRLHRGDWFLQGAFE